MTLNVNQPTDQALVSSLPEYIRESRVAINLLESGVTDVVNTTLSLTAGATSLTVGIDLSSALVETVLISALGACTIFNIIGGTEGQIKIFIFQDNDITLTDGLKSDGALYLNQLPALSNFSAQQDDIIALLNIDGDGSSTYGYWKELWRQISVK